MPITDTPVIPDNATPDRCAEVIDAYACRLLERSDPAFGSDPDRVKKVESDLSYIEANLAYWLGFLVGPDGSSTGLVSEILAQIEELRTAYSATYTVPDIAGNAQKLALSLSKRTKASRTASVARQQAKNAPQTPPQAPEPPPLAPSTTGIVLTRLEAAMARMLGMNPEQYREYTRKVTASS